MRPRSLLASLLIAPAIALAASDSASAIIIVPTFPHSSRPSRHEAPAPPVQRWDGLDDAEGDRSPEQVLLGPRPTDLRFDTGGGLYVRIPAIVDVALPEPSTDQIAQDSVLAASRARAQGHEGVARVQVKMRDGMQVTLQSPLDAPGLVQLGSTIKTHDGVAQVTTVFRDGESASKSYREGSHLIIAALAIVALVGGASALLIRAIAD